MTDGADSEMKIILTLSLILCMSKSRISSIKGELQGNNTLEFIVRVSELCNLSKNYLI